jgi:pyruvate-formate lyase
MDKQITLHVAEDEFTQANQAALLAGFKLEEYLNMVLTAIGSPQHLNEDVIERIFHLLPSDLVMQLANAKMSAKQSEHFSRLLQKHEDDKISQKERERLSELADEYERGTLRKAYAMAEAVRRGLMPPLNS